MKPDNKKNSGMASQHPLFTGSYTLADLIEANYKLLSVLSRMDVQLSFGDVSVEQICRRYNLSAELFLMICNISTYSDYRPDVGGLSDDDIRRIMRYLRLSHSYYVNVSMPKIRSGVSALAGDCDDIQEKVLIKFFDDFESEMKLHFDEEESAFSGIDGMLSSGGGEAELPPEVVEAHDDLCDKMDDIKSIIIKYLPESCPTELRLEVLMEIYRLREDIRTHILIESRMLVPALAGHCGRAES